MNSQLTSSSTAMLVPYCGNTVKENWKSDLAVEKLAYFYYFQTHQCPELSCSMALQLCGRKQRRQSKQLHQEQRCPHYCCCWMLNLGLIFHVFIPVGRVILPFSLQNRKHTFHMLLLWANTEASGFSSGSYWV